MTLALSAGAPTLASPLLTTRVRMAIAVVGAALLTAAAAQLTIHLPWTPVPITGQTFAVLLAGSVLGMRAGAASQLLYVALGAIGLPFYADASGGIKIVTGATGGYLFSYFLAAALVGYLAERRQDRSLITSFEAMLAGTAVIYVCGVAWLAHSLHVSTNRAIGLGMTPFLIGDGVKIIVVGLSLPLAWRVTGYERRSHRRPDEPDEAAAE
jgi:biotin transport system substrate-specific component